MSQLIFCRGEGRTFSDDQFLYNQNGTIFDPHIHKVPTPHFALTGQKLAPPPLIIPGPLFVRLHNALGGMSEEEIEKWVTDREKK